MSTRQFIGASTCHGSNAQVWTPTSPFELGVAKPDPAIFTKALQRLGLGAEQVLMVGERGTHDGAAADLGITTLLLPPLRVADDARLHHVLHLVLPGTTSML